MNLNRLDGVLALSLVGALAFVGCSDDDNEDNQPGLDAGSGNNGQPDGTTGDGGPDGGNRADGGVAETGPVDLGPDAGSMLPREAEPCGTGMPACADGLSCVNFGGTNLICLNVCQQDSDCAGSTLVPVAATCANEGRLTAQDGTMFGWCVQEEVSEGTVITDPPDPNATGVKLRACSMTQSGISVSDTEVKCVLNCTTDAECAASTSTPAATFCGGNGTCANVLRGEGSLATVSATTTEGCRADLTAFGPDAAQPGKLECARECATNADCPVSDIGFCNVNRGFFGPGLTGVCTKREGAFGSPCSNRHVVERCTLDFEGEGLVLCRDFFGTIGDTEAFNGVCSGFCGDTDGDPMTAAVACVTPFTRPGDPTPRCILQTTEGNPIFNNPNVGICSDDCTDSPNSCGGAISTTCYDVQTRFNSTIDFAQCVESAQPELAAWYPGQGSPTPAQQCDMRWHRCPDDTHCVGVQLQGASTTACIIGCDATAPAGRTGCEGKTIGGQTNLTCTALQQGQADGLCEPVMP